MKLRSNHFFRNTKTANSNSYNNNIILDLPLYQQNDYFSIVSIKTNEKLYNLTGDIYYYDNNVY